MAILLVSLNHDRSDPYVEKTRQILEASADDDCRVIQFTDVSKRAVMDGGAAPWAICHSGGRGAGPCRLRWTAFERLFRTSTSLSSASAEVFSTWLRCSVAG